MKRKRLERALGGIVPETSAIVGRQLTALPEIEASDEVDCSPDSIKIVLSIRALISVANYNCVQSRGEREGKERREEVT